MLNRTSIEPLLRSARAIARPVASGVAIVALAACAVASDKKGGAPGEVEQGVLAGVTFEGGDGNLVVDTAGNTDWANAPHRAVGVDKASGSTDNSFGQGTKEDDPDTVVVTGSIPPNKNDLTRFYVGNDTAQNGDIFLYLAWERAVNIGNANLDFEINQTATSGFGTSTTGAVTLTRTAGDLLVTYDFAGSGTPTLGLLTWLTADAGNTASQCFSANALPCWGKRIALNGTNSEGAVNTATVTDPVPPGAPRTLGVGLFGEASINLTAAGVFQPGVCEAFGSAFVKSRSSSAFTAEIKDFIAPTPITISNCGTITIHKVTQNGDGTFGFTTTGAGLSSFSLANGGQKAFSTLSAGSYSVTENLTSAQIAAGWTLSGIACTSSGAGTSATVSGSTVNVTLGLAGTVDCTYTNHTKLHPTIATTLSSSSVVVGSAVHDSSALSGATSDAGGTVTYTVYTDTACSQGAQSAGTVTVTNGVVPDSNAITFGAAGDYYWQAVYSGDANNAGATSVCTSEHLVVTKASPAISTAQRLVPNDKATISGAYSPTGSITFQLFPPSDATCAGAPSYAETVTVNGNGDYSTSNSSFVAATEGTWRWRVSYGGDANNAAATSACGTERFTIANQ